MAGVAPALQLLGQDPGEVEGFRQPSPQALDLGEQFKADGLSPCLVAGHFEALLDVRQPLLREAAHGRTSAEIVSALG